MSHKGDWDRTKNKKTFDINYINIFSVCKCSGNPIIYLWDKNKNCMVCPKCRKIMK